MSESDFASIPRLLHFLNKTSLQQVYEIPKKYDFVYIIPSDHRPCAEGWQAHCRNWNLAKKCLPVLCLDLNLKGLLIGRDCRRDLVNLGVQDQITQKHFLEYPKFLLELASSKMLFVPNESDASPRVITESLTLNVPVLLNTNIVGGHKYIRNGVSGCHFVDEHDVNTSAKIALQSTQSNEYFHGVWGAEHSAKKLAQFLRRVFPTKNFPEEVYISVN